MAELGLLGRVSLVPLGGERHAIIVIDKNVEALTRLADRHVVGLDHPKRSDPAQIMFASTTTKEAVWGAGDLVGLRALGASSGCFTGDSPATGKPEAKHEQARHLQTSHTGRAR